MNAVDKIFNEGIQGLNNEDDVIPVVLGHPADAADVA